jgi:hypothetical protein
MEEKEYALVNKKDDAARWGTTCDMDILYTSNEM